MTVRASFLRRLDLPEDLPAKSVEFEWHGMAEHLAPINATPLAKALMKKTNSALLTLGAGCLLWAEKRLRFVTDAEPLALIAEVTLLWEDSPHYYHHPGPRPAPTLKTPQYEAVVALFYQTTSIFKTAVGRHISHPPVQTIENLFALTRHVLGEEWTPAFREWTKQAIATMNRLAPNPHQDFRDRFDFDSDEEWEAYKALNMGRPIAIEACNPGSDLSNEQSDALYLDFMLEADPAENRYLALPDLMESRGFSGTPYRPRSRQ
ncbi:MAG: hypothetical protein U1E58_10355 [Tabrizicola sp.]